MSREQNSRGDSNSSLQYSRRPRPWHNKRYENSQRNSDRDRNDYRRNSHKDYRHNYNYQYHRNYDRSYDRHRWERPYDRYYSDQQRNEGIFDQAANICSQVLGFDIRNPDLLERFRNEPNPEQSESFNEITSSETVNSKGNQAKVNNSFAASNNSTDCELKKQDECIEDSSNKVDSSSTEESVSEPVTSSDLPIKVIETILEPHIVIKQEVNTTKPFGKPSQSSSNDTPEISLVPLSLLLEPTLVQSVNPLEDIKPDIEAIDSASSENPSTSPAEFPFKEPEKISKKLINQVATMDKTNIRNVINNPILKFDVALKLHAKKRLREEIRKQLRNITVETKPTSAQKIDDFRPDEFIDSENIPQELLRQYQSILNIDFGDEQTRPITTCQSTISQMGNENSSAVGQEVSLRTKLLNFEFIQQQAILRKRKLSSENDTYSDDDDVCIIEPSPQQIVAIDQDESSSDSSTTNTSAASSYAEPQWLGKFLDTFKRDLLPSLPEHIRREYENMSQNGETLSKIYNMCIEKLSNGNVRNNLAPTHFNVSNSDEAVKFLLQNIKTLLDQQSSENIKSGNRCEAQKTRSPEQQRTDQKDHQNIKDHPKEWNKQSLVSRDASRVDSSNRSDEVSSGVLKKKSTSYSRESSNEKPRQPDSSPYKRTSDDRRKCKDNPSKRHDSSVNRSTQKPNNRDKEIPRNERSWRSPGEKKCLPVISSTSSQFKTVSEPVQPELPSETNQTISSVLRTTEPLEIQQIAAIAKETTAGKDVLQSLKTIDSKLMNLNNKKVQIEKNIIQLQKKKMEIELATMQLQSDRFALISSFTSSPNTFNLSNFSELQMLQSNPRTNESSKRKRNNKSQNSKKKNQTQATPNGDKKKSDFAEKLKNRKKRCQRDILIEDAAATLFSKDDQRREDLRNSPPSELSAKVEHIFSMPTRRSTLKPVQVVSPEKSKAEPTKMRQSHLIVESNNALLPVSCVGNSINIVDDCDSSDNESDELNCSVSSSRSVSIGPLKGFRLPIVEVIMVEGYMLCASEDGSIYKFDSSTRQLISTFSKHTEAITQIYVANGCLYSTSLDGFLKGTSVENFGLELLSVNFHEPLQTIFAAWKTAFIGSRWGNIFKYNLKKNQLNETLLCSVESSVTALYSSKEGPRRILIICSKSDKMEIRDAINGLLLRTMSVPNGLHVSSIAFHNTQMYCGTNGNKVLLFDFTSGYQVDAYSCGAGASVVRIYKNKFLFIGCYDGFVYVLDKTSGQQLGRFPGAGKMILALSFVGEKLLTSSRDNTVEIIDIPKYIQAKLT